MGVGKYKIYHYPEEIFDGKSCENFDCGRKYNDQTKSP
jgi:hypothetical protein